MLIERTQVGKILVIKLRAIGDVLLSTVVLRSLREAFPSATIDFLTEPPARRVVEGNPSVDEVLIFDAAIRSGAGLIADVRKRRYDLVIDLFGNPRSALVTALSGARYRVGYRFGWRRRCYNIVVEPRGASVHNTEFNLDAIRAIGLEADAPKPVFPLTEQARKFAASFFSREDLIGRTVVAINAGGGWYTKRWPPDRFAQLADRLAGEEGCAIILLWGPGERSPAEELRALMHAPALLIPESDLTGLGAILELCGALITNDSGPMHIAAAVGTPVVAIFGPTNPDLQGPVSPTFEIVRNETLLCLGCNLTKCPIGNPCMKELEVTQVLDAFTRVIRKAGATTAHHQTS